MKEPLCIRLLSWEKCTMPTADNAHFQLCKDTWIEKQTIAKIDGSDTYKYCILKPLHKISHSWKITEPHIE